MNYSLVALIYRCLFGLGRTLSGFIFSIDIFRSNHKICWQNKFLSFSGYRFMIAGQKWLDCRHHGKDRNVRSKEKQREVKNAT